MTHNLDLRGIACPLNFVKTKLYLDKLSNGEFLEVCLDAGEPIESVYKSIKAEGHETMEPQMKSDGSYSLTIKKMSILLALFLYYLPFSSVLAQATTMVPNSLGKQSLAKQNSTTQNLVKKNISLTSSNNIAQSLSVDEQINLAREAVNLAPTDIEKRLNFSRLLRRSGKTKEAAIQYLNITVLNPGYALAYHEMLLCQPNAGQIDEAIDRLKKLDAAKANQLLPKMALSELYERKEDYYQAARVLVDLQYSQNIPQKYVAQIASRIHMLLGKTKDTRTVEKAIEQKTNVEEAEFNPSTPLPMPDITVSKNAPISKLRTTKMKEGYGHTQLLP